MAKRPGQIRRVRLPLWAGWLSWVLTVMVLAAAVGFAVGPLARAQGWTTDGGSPTVDPQIIADIHSDPSGNGVIGAASEPNYHGVSADRIADVIAATQPTLAGSYGGAIADLDGAGLSYEFSAHTPLTPASTLKVMTATAITDALGADHSFTTSVVATSADAIVLVGGGDPLLASAPTSYSGSSAIALPTTADLAARTAAALQAQGISRVSLGYDDSLFSGPVWHADWPEGDRQFVAPISALVIDEGAAVPGTESGSQVTAGIFADQLRAAGIDVTGDVVAASATGGSELAKVASAPLGLLVQEMLTHSDNFIAEMLLRQLGIAKGQAGSFEGGAAALTASLTDLGLWDDGQLIVDGSGLSVNNRITPAALVKALQLSAARPELSAVLAGLPVAAATGTLGTRFADDQSAAARGLVRAKSGSLDGVSSLAGYTPSSDGALIAFAVIGNGLPTDQDIRPWFDHVAAALAGCDCAG